LQPADDGIAEALIFHGQDEFLKMRKRSRQAHIADLIDRIGAAERFRKSLGATIGWRKTITPGNSKPVWRGITLRQPMPNPRRICGTRITIRRRRHSGFNPGFAKRPDWSGSDIIMACEGHSPHLPLAARPRVGHIGLTGAVAEWLKAAVC
jgi:hypothetical protein